jgi:hypothetical protein
VPAFAGTTYLPLQNLENDVVIQALSDGSDKDVA